MDQEMPSCIRPMVSGTWQCSTASYFQFCCLSNMCKHSVTLTSRIVVRKYLHFPSLKNIHSQYVVLMTSHIEWWWWWWWWWWMMHKTQHLNMILHTMMNIEWWWITFKHHWTPVSSKWFSTTLQSWNNLALLSTKNYSTKCMSSDCHLWFSRGFSYILYIYHHHPFKATFHGGTIPKC